jgi:AraC-like DNA-binding protein
MLKQARLLLGANLDRRMLVGHVAGKLGVGYEAFRKKFSKAYGISPKAYRVSRRLDKAEVLIRHTDMSIKEIAASLGYPNDSDFIRQYKKHRKSPPGKLMTDSGFCP